MHPDTYTDIWRREQWKDVMKSKGELTTVETPRMRRECEGKSPNKNDVEFL